LSQETYVISREDYLKDISRTIEAIKNTKLAKVIVSRLIPHTRKKESIGEVYLQLFKQTPNAFVYMVNLPSNKKIAHNRTMDGCHS
jgi:isochorismate synthase